MKLWLACTTLALLAAVSHSQAKGCMDQCYSPEANGNCLPANTPASTMILHITVHPHLDAFWIFNFETYYHPPADRKDIAAYFEASRFTPVSEIFTTAAQVLQKSKEYREAFGEGSQRARRTFTTSEVGFFKRWWRQQVDSTKEIVKGLLKSGHWEILNGGFVENDEAAAYYDDIIENYQIGCRFLEEEFNGYIPKVAIAADAFGHSQSMAALLVHFGIEGFIVERADEHILENGSLEFLWKAMSANQRYYGTIPTHIRWTIHGFQEQFKEGPLQPVCSTKSAPLERMRAQNRFIRKLYANQEHILRYFGNDFQKFDEDSYKVIEAMMRQFSKESCSGVAATYTNPTQYFRILLSEVHNKKPLPTRTHDLFPIWDYDSGLYWTGYFTTDPHHKKAYRDAGRFLQFFRKMFLPLYLAEPKSKENVQIYDRLQRYEQQVAYLQHHDGITGTTKYDILDQHEHTIEFLQNWFIEKVVRSAFEQYAQSDKAEQTVFECFLEEDCVVHDPAPDQFQLLVFNSGGVRAGIFKIHLPLGVYYSSSDAETQTVCFCQVLPCNCTIYVFNTLPPNYSKYIFHKRMGSPPFTLEPLPESDEFFTYNNTHLSLSINSKQYHISYQRTQSEPTERSYKRTDSQGRKDDWNVTIQSGKYALGNNPVKTASWSSIRNVAVTVTDHLLIYVVSWQRAGMLTILTTERNDLRTWKIQTHSAAENYHTADYFLAVDTPVANGGVFFTDSNGWLVTKREIVQRESEFDELNGNVYPITSFAYIQDRDEKVSVGSDRAQGVVSPREGSLWLNFDRLTGDDGKWLFQKAFRSEYQKFTHFLSVQNTNYKERELQVSHDNGVFLRAVANTNTAEISVPNASNIGSKQSHSREPTLINSESATQMYRLAGLTNPYFKFSVKVWNDSTGLLRVHNLHDETTQELTLFASNTSVVLSAFYGRELTFDTIYETTLQGNQPYQAFLKNKPVWSGAIEEENDLLNKQFGERIRLRPLEIRTFKFTNLRFREASVEPNNLQFSNVTSIYGINHEESITSTPLNNVLRTTLDYLLNQDHCDSRNPPSNQQPSQEDRKEVESKSLRAMNIKETGIVRP